MIVVNIRVLHMCFVIYVDAPWYAELYDLDGTPVGYPLVYVDNVNDRTYVLHLRPDHSWGLTTL